MNAAEIKDLLIVAIPEGEIEVEGGGGKYVVSAVADMFENLNAVQRQQAIYSVLNKHISSGEIHAVSMRLQTKVEANSTE
ncbi:MAG: BolA/IbaG family iron-sulfur metabolism protein [Gammaproteobacteria bacterium]|nr:BolA/IbaG family iron-sulfur metabolism protein [Gammaproteobacteria bacterium]